MLLHTMGADNTIRCVEIECYVTKQAHVHEIDGEDVDGDDVDGEDVDGDDVD